MKSQISHISKIYAFFNVSSLLFNLMIFVINDFLSLYEKFSNFLFYLDIFLKISMILFSMLYYLIFLRFPQTRRKMNKIVIVLFEKLYDLIPMFEILIEINIKFRFYIEDSKFYCFYYLKIVYFLCKWFMIMIKNSNSVFFSIFFNSAYIIIITINIYIILKLNDENKDIMVFFELVLAVFSLNILIRLFKNSSLAEKMIFTEYLSEINDSVSFISEETYNDKKNRKFRIFYTNKKTLDLLKLKLDKNQQLNFSDFNKKIRHFRLNKVKLRQKVNEDKTLYPLKPQKLSPFDSLTEMLNFYNSYQDNKVIITFLRLSKDDSNKTERQFPLTDLKLTLMKTAYGNKQCFFIQIKEIEKIICLKETSKFKTRLLKSISHEIMTPLNGSLTLLELLRNERFVEDDVSSLYLDNCLASLKLLENTLNNIVDYNEMISDQFIICMSSINLNNLMNEIFLITKSQVELKKVEYTIELDGLLSKIPIYTDYSRLKQILLNVILNSIQFTNRGLIKIEVHVM